MIDLSWVGGMPTNWKAVPLKSKFTFGKGLSITKADLVDEGVPVLSYGQIHSKANLRVRIDDSLLRFVPQFIANEGKDSLAVKNGFIFADTSEDLDGCGNCNYVDRDDVYGGYHTVVLKPKASTDTDHRYLAYLFQTDAWRFQIRKELTEVKVFSISQKVLKSTWILVPPLPEQRAIVAYLDSKCAAIDEAIERHKKIIEKLEEYRKAEISRTVTVGMSADVSMSYSGNKCIGNIPTHWKCCKILYVLSMPITDGPHETPTAVDEGIPFISAEAVSQGNGKIDFDHMWGYISHEFYEQCCKKYIPQRDDIYMIKSGATTGKVAIVDTDKVFTIWSPLAVLRVDKSKMIAKYLFYYVQSNGYQQQVELGWNYGTQQNIGMRMVERLKVCVPTLEEQQLIVEHLDKVWDEVNTSIERENTIIAKLDEYRKSIIYNAVTGKIDCRMI